MESSSLTPTVDTVKYGSLDENYHKLHESSIDDVASGSTLVHQTDHSEVEFLGVHCSLRKLALSLSLYLNILITLAKLVAYLRTFSLSVLAALLDSVLDVVSQVVLNYTEKHSSLQRSSALYPAGASRLEPIGVLTCAALMGVASFEVLKESLVTLFARTRLAPELGSVWSMLAIVLIKVGLLILCNRAKNARFGFSKHALMLTDPTLEALAQDHANDALSNLVAAVALVSCITTRICGLWTPLRPFSSVFTLSTLGTRRGGNKLST